MHRRRNRKCKDRHADEVLVAFDDDVVRRFWAAGSSKGLGPYERPRIRAAALTARFCDWKRLRTILAISS